MLVNGRKQRSQEVDRPLASTHPLDPRAGDTTELTPLCGEVEFAALLASMVADEAPRLFAVVQVYGERVDGRIAGWGMAFDDRAEVVSARRGVWSSLEAPEQALRLFEPGGNIRARLVWLDPDAATLAE